MASDVSSFCLMKLYLLNELKEMLQQIFLKIRCIFIVDTSIHTTHYIFVYVFYINENE